MEPLPESYTTLPLEHISLSHYPTTSLAVSRIIIIHLDHVERQNAFSPQMEMSLVRAFRLLDRDARVKAIVVTGRGDMFCAGADLQIGLRRTPGVANRDPRDGLGYYAGGRSEPQQLTFTGDSGGRVALAIHHCRKPTIAALQGSAVGIGITMTLPMCIRIASATAKVGFVFAQRGVVMEAASSFFLPRLIGHSKALYLTSTGGVFPASSPHFGDLFHEVLPRPEDVLPRALQLATQIITSTSTISTYLMREMMWRPPGASGGSAEEAHLLGSEIMHNLYETHDMREGMNSFLDKRPANFKSDLDNDLPANLPWWTPVDTRPKQRNIQRL